ncbi:hypothetical protein [Actinomadura sp. J1-007]|uniref:hypothetical protein n=1 Tax=Actinomadura sp. J1-007 TaxID=2661913 RepID=UPI00136ECEAF|nr:hypothetical protein [Actinomadura sp. J1-007]
MYAGVIVPQAPPIATLPPHAGVDRTQRLARKGCARAWRPLARKYRPSVPVGLRFKDLEPGSASQDHLVLCYVAPAKGGTFAQAVLPNAVPI